MDRLMKAQLDDIKRLASGQTCDEDLRKTIFESWAHVRIPLGGQRYKIKRLDGPAPGTEDVVTFRSMATRRFGNLRDFVNEPLANGEYAQPLIPIIGAVDSLVKPDILFQMTVAADHPTKAALLVDAIDAVDPQATPPPTPAGQQPAERIVPPIRLYFVIPPDLWTTFGKQPYHSVDPQSDVLPPGNIPLCFIIL